MGSADRFFTSGPAESRSVRILFYLGEGTMVGAMLYFVVSIVFLAGFTPALGRLTAFTGLFETEYLVFGFVLLLIFLLGFRNAWAVLAAGRKGPRSWVYEEWKMTRHGLWVFVVASLVTVALIGISALIWGWESAWYRPNAILLITATMLFGLLLRMLVRRRIESHAHST